MQALSRSRKEVSLFYIAPLAGSKSYTGEVRASSTKPPEGAGGQSSDPMSTSLDMFTAEV